MNDSSKKANREKFDVADYHKFMLEFLKESDRAAVVLGAARLDDLLRQILRKVLVTNSKKDDDLLDPENPIGSFGARINLVGRLGLISPSFVRHLHLVRKLRNVFAHESDSISLENSTYIEQVLEIARPYRKERGLDELWEISLTKYGMKLSKTSFIFRTSVGFSGAMLFGLSKSCKPLYWKKPIGLPGENSRGERE